MLRLIRRFELWLGGVSDGIFEELLKAGLFIAAVLLLSFGLVILTHWLGGGNFCK